MAPFKSVQPYLLLFIYLLLNFIKTTQAINCQICHAFCDLNTQSYNSIHQKNCCQGILPKNYKNQNKTCPSNSDLCVTTFDKNNIGLNSYAIYRNCYSIEDKEKFNEKFGFNSNIDKEDLQGLANQIGEMQMQNVDIRKKCICDSDYCNTSTDPSGKDCLKVKAKFLNYFDEWDFYDSLFLASMGLFLVVCVYDEFKFKRDLKKWKKRAPGVFNRF